MLPPCSRISRSLLRAQHRPAQIDRHQPIPVAHRHVGERAAEQDGSVVDQDVQPAEFVPDAGKGHLDRDGVGDIQHQCRGTQAQGTEPGNGDGQFRFGTAGDDGVSALAGQRFGGGCADASAAAGDESHLIVEGKHRLASDRCGNGAANGVDSIDTAGGVEAQARFQSAFSSKPMYWA